MAHLAPNFFCRGRNTSLPVADLHSMEVANQPLLDLASAPVRHVSAADLGLRGTAVWRLAGSLPPAPRLAIVGSRAARRLSIASVAEIVACAANAGMAVVSGGARGIDAAVHRAALAAGVPQLAVLPCAPGHPYPPEHAGLFAEILATPGSGLLFGADAGAEPSRGMFASRNRLVVAAARAVVIVEAQVRSGSWGTGRLARQRKRPLAAILGTPGCAELIGLGAHALPGPGPELAQATATWLADLDNKAAARSPSAWPDELQWLATALLRAGPRGLSINDLDDCDRASTALLAAELLGLVGESLPGRFHALR